jgi:dehydrogenase/reductase SDR family protein 7
VALAEKCRAVGAHDAMAVRLDALAPPETHAAVVDSVVRKFGRIDVLVNNAGRSQRGLVERTPLAVDREMFELNVLGVLSVTKAALPHMLAAGRGVVANTASVAGKTGSPISATYAATKAAVLGFMNSLRMEAGWRGLSVVNVCPGPVDSEVTLHAFTEAPGAELGKPAEDAATRMPARRCARLMAAAIWARLPEAWIAPQPILLYTYVAQFCPALFFSLGQRAGRRRVEALQRGSTGYDSIRSVWGTLFGGGGGGGSGGGAAKQD